VDAGAKVFRFKRFRAAAEGEALRGLLEYEVSYEFAESDFHWKDVYVNVRKWRGVQVRGGRFRIPFSLDQLTGPTNLDFVERSRIADRLAPNRDTGVLAHGSLLAQTVKYQFGRFNNDGDNAADRNNVRTGQGTWAGRLTGRPLPASKLFETLTLGGAFTHSDVPEGLYSLRLRSAHNETVFPNYFVYGRRLRTGAEALWMPGPVSVKAEFIDVREGRKAQGLAGDDLPDLLERGWYVSGTWAVTGQNKAKGFDRGKYIPFVGGWGAVELAARAEQIRFASATGEGRPSRSIRASNVLRQSDRAWTFGVNWYMNQWIKFQANFMREWIEDSFRAPIPGQNVYWSYKFRLQGSL
jgi:phosphate-selective porin OprO/OprP